MGLCIDMEGDPPERPDGCEASASKVVAGQLWLGSVGYHSPDDFTRAVYEGDCRLQRLLELGPRPGRVSVSVQLQPPRAGPRELEFHTRSGDLRALAVLLHTRHRAGLRGCLPQARWRRAPTHTGQGGGRPF